MQTIKVTTTATAYGLAFSIEGGNFLAAVGDDITNPGKWCGGNSQFGACRNCSFAEAVEFVGDAIERHFEPYGLNVEFVNA